MLRCELVLVTRSWCYAVNLFLELGTQCVDRWWQSLEKALPQSLHVKDKPGGGIAEKLILGLRVAKQFSQPWPCQLNKRWNVYQRVSDYWIYATFLRLFLFEKKLLLVSLQVHSTLLLLYFILFHFTWLSLVDLRLCPGHLRFWVTSRISNWFTAFRTSEMLLYFRLSWLNLFYSTPLLSSLVIVALRLYATFSVQCLCVEVNMNVIGTPPPTHLHPNSNIYTPTPPLCVRESRVSPLPPWRHPVFGSSRHHKVNRIQSLSIWIKGNEPEMPTWFWSADKKIFR